MRQLEKMRDAWSGFSRDREKEEKTKVPEMRYISVSESISRACRGRIIFTRAISEGEKTTRKEKIESD